MMRGKGEGGGVGWGSSETGRGTGGGQALCVWCVKCTNKPAITINNQQPVAKVGWEPQARTNQPVQINNQLQCGGPNQLGQEHKAKVKIMCNKRNKRQQQQTKCKNHRVCVVKVKGNVCKAKRANKYNNQIQIKGEGGR